MPAGTSDAQSEAPAAARPVVDLEERGWLPRHCRGDETAFPALLAAYRRPLYGYLVRSGVREAERDDLFQSIVLKIHQAAARYQPARPLAPWLFTIAANTVRNHFRDSPDASLVSTADDLAETPDPVPGPERVLEARETVAWLEAEIAALPEMQRQVL
ncbi:MAG: sigma-70 family RNA polymerase sigma factor, partial [bacterium]|nr:sigma-70 family RNA polymerase sigma factor [bacterium]